jgi:PKD repeat protein
MSQTTSTLLRTLASAAVTAGLLAAVTPAQALNQFLKTWQDTYPGSTTDDASCSVCHGTANTNLNAYGKALCDAFGGSLPANIVPALQAIEALDSDLDPTESSNIVEIDANAQPGWTEGAVNQIYAADVGGLCAAIGSPISVPTTVPRPYDPPVDGMPVAIPGGPYAGFVNVPITFDGSGSYDSDDIGEGIVSYDWSFGDGATGTGMTAKHTYTVAGTYIVSLTVIDGEGATNTNSTIATISGNAVLDLDIAAFKVTKSVSVGKPIAIQVSVENPGTVLGQALATVVGTRDGIQVYKWSLNVYDYNGKGTTSFNFPTYVPTAKGTINWTVTIADVDPDPDLATATTTVK